MFRQMSRPGVRGVVGGTGNLRLRCETANIIADSVLTTCVAVWCVVCGVWCRRQKYKKMLWCPSDQIHWLATLQS